MLFEDDVVEAVARFFENRGWAVESRVTAREHGDDLVLVKPGRRLLVEAKGETSSNPRSSRFGLEFTSSQVGTHVGVAILRALRWVSAGDVDAAIAVPDNERHRVRVGEVNAAIQRAGIGVLWVGQDRQVRPECPWQV